MGNCQSNKYSQVQLNTFIQQQTEHILQYSKLYKSSLNQYYLEYKQRVAPPQPLIHFIKKYTLSQYSDNNNKLNCIDKQKQNQYQLQIDKNNMNNQIINFQQIAIVPIIHYQYKKNKHLCIQQKQFVFIFPYYNWTLDKYLKCSSSSLSANNHNSSFTKSKNRSRLDQILYVLEQMLKILIKLDEEKLKLSLFKNGIKQIYLNLKGRPCIYLLAYQQNYQQNTQQQNNFTRLTTSLLQALTNHTLTQKNKRYLPTLVQDQQVAVIFKSLLNPMSLQQQYKVLQSLKCVRKKYPLKSKALGRKRNNSELSQNPTPTKRRRNSFILSSRIKINHQHNQTVLNMMTNTQIMSDKHEKQFQKMKQAQKDYLKKSNVSTIRPRFSYKILETQEKNYSNNQRKVQINQNKQNQRQQFKLLKTHFDYEIPHKIMDLSMNYLYSNCKNNSNFKKNCDQSESDLEKSNRKQQVWRKAVIPIKRSIVFQ